MSLRYLILHNFWLKLWSLFFAGLIWLAISQSDQKVIHALIPSHLQTLELRCPVGLLLSPANGSPITVEPPGVLVKVAGADANLKNLTPENIQVYVKLPHH